MKILDTEGTTEILMKTLQGPDSAGTKAAHIFNERDSRREKLSPLAVYRAHGSQSAGGGCDRSVSVWY
jgi:hypothetical protein